MGICGFQQPGGNVRYNGVFYKLMCYFQIQFHRFYVNMYVMKKDFRNPPAKV